MDSGTMASETSSHSIPKLIRYILAGSFMTAFVIGLFWLLSGPLGINYVASNIIATTTSVIVGFFVHAHYTHADKKKQTTSHGDRRQFVKFVGLSVANIGLSALLMIAFVTGLALPEVPSQALTSLIIAAWTYTAQLLFVFV